MAAKDVHVFVDIDDGGPCKDPAAVEADIDLGALRCVALTGRWHNKAARCWTWKTCSC
jgi:hypothetical protein